MEQPKINLYSIHVEICLGLPLNAEDWERASIYIYSHFLSIQIKFPPSIT